MVFLVLAILFRFARFGCFVSLFRVLVHAKHLHKADLKNNVLIVMLILCLQRVIKMARNLLQSVLWPLVLRVCDKETS